MHNFMSLYSQIVQLKWVMAVEEIHRLSCSTANKFNFNCNFKVMLQNESDVSIVLCFFKRTVQLFALVTQYT